MRLLLVRHGQTASNVKRLLDTAAPGPGLTDLGREQAEALVEALGEEKIESAYASTLVRTQETAQPLAAALGLDVTIREGLREVIAGDLEMHGEGESVEIYLTTCFAWAAGDLDRRMPGAEDGHEFLARMDGVVAEIAAGCDGTAVAFSHGAAIRAWAAARGENITVEWAAERPLANTGVVVLEGDPEQGWTVLTWAGEPVGGPEVDTRTPDGPAGQPIEPGF